MRLSVAYCGVLTKAVTRSILCAAPCRGLNVSYRITSECVVGQPLHLMRRSVRTHPSRASASASRVLPRGRIAWACANRRVFEVAICGNEQSWGEACKTATCGSQRIWPHQLGGSFLKRSQSASRSKSKEIWRSLARYSSWEAVLSMDARKSCASVMSP